MSAKRCGWKLLDPQGCQVIARHDRVTRASFMRWLRGRPEVLRGRRLKGMLDAGFRIEPFGERTMAWIEAGSVQTELARERPEQEERLQQDIELGRLVVHRADYLMKREGCAFSDLHAWHSNRALAGCKAMMWVVWLYVWRAVGQARAGAGRDVSVMAR